MPTASPIMEASTGVISLMSSETSVPSWTSMSPMPTPTIAEISGMPAATTEPKVTRRTRAATARPSNSEVKLMVIAELKALPL